MAFGGAIIGLVVGIVGGVIGITIINDVYFAAGFSSSVLNTVVSNIPVIMGLGLMGAAAGFYRY